MYLKNKSKILQREKGITLIALVVTIVVLLILAGVSISMLSGDDGIITNAGKAKDQNDQSALEEEVGLAISSNNINKQTGGASNLEGELSKIEGATVTKLAEDMYYVEREGHGVTVCEDGTVTAENVDVWDGGESEKPEVDAQGNWHIYTTEQMKFLEEYCNDKLEDDEKSSMPDLTSDTIVYLENTLDMGARQESGVLTTAPETQWYPIRAFEATFEGNGHTILGIYVKEDISCGIFRYTTGDIKNLTIKDSYIEGKADFYGVGGIVGTSRGNMVNCHNKNTKVISNDGITGGISGMTGDGTTVEDCSNSGEVISKNKARAGGIAGQLGMFGGKSIIKNCKNTGKIQGNKWTGGICGVSANGGIIQNCENTGMIIGGEQTGRNYR